MKHSDKCIALIKEFEGYHEELGDGRCRAYRCPAGIMTIGYGTTEYHDGRNVKRGDILTEEDATFQLNYDINKIHEQLDGLIFADVNQCQYDAIVSFCYNCGVNAFKNSTLIKLLNAGKYNDAANEFYKWVHGDGKVLPGLVRRRRNERLMFIGELKGISSYIIEYGDMGIGVTNIQIMLNTWLKNRHMKLLHEDGVFGRNTLNVLNKFQENNNIDIENGISSKCWDNITGTHMKYR